MSDLVHVAFRSKETGRYLFHGKWPREDVEKVEAAAGVLGISVDELIAFAIQATIDHDANYRAEQDPPA